MADITPEQLRDRLRQRQEPEALQREIAATKQWCVELWEQSPLRCTCDHAPHELVHAWMGTELLWCLDESCLCGVEPCPACGNHARYVNDTTARHWRCRQCGAAWPAYILA